MKQYYSAPHLEQVRMEAEMPVMAGSIAPGPKGLGAGFTKINGWGS